MYINNEAIHFLNHNGERLAIENGESKDPDTIIARIKKQKYSGEIENVEEVKTDKIYIFKIKYKGAGTKQLLIANNADGSLSAEAIRIRTILNSNFKKREIIININEENEALVRTRDGSKSGKTRNVNEIISYLNYMKDKKQFKKVTKHSSRLNRYSFLDKEDDIFTVLVSKENEEVTKSLDKLTNDVIKYRRKPFVVGGLVLATALFVTNPYTRQTIHDFSVKQDARLENEYNFSMLNSYYTRFVSDNLSDADIIAFEMLLNQTISYYEENNDTYSDDYLKLMTYKEALNERKIGPIR